MQSYLSGNTGIRIVTPTQEIKAHVVPISKSNPASADNLRPVSLIHHFAKIAEKFIAKWAVQDKQPFIDTFQYGYQSRISNAHLIPG